MMYLYAAARHPLLGIVDVALVMRSEDDEAIAEKKLSEEICWSDKDLEYFVLPSPVDPEPNEDYNKLCERHMK